jgi:integrase
VWEKLLKKQVKDLMAGAVPGTVKGTGWSVLPGRNNTVCLQYRQPGKRTELHPSQTVTLSPYRWDESAFADILQRCRQIRQRMVTEKEDLKTAAIAASGASSRTTEDWGEAIKKFEEYKRHHGKVCIGDRTWNEHYDPFLQRLLPLLRRKGDPRNAADALEEVARNWGAGTTMRRHCVQNLSQFLKFSVERLKFSPVWTPPSSIAEIVGDTRDAKPKRIGYPLLDSEVLRVVNELHDPRWCLAVKLCAEFGLRPEDIRYLTVRDGNPWSDYRKAGGGGLTKPRRLFALKVVDADGTPQEWDLVGAIQRGEHREIFLGRPGKAGTRMGNFLIGTAIWSQLRKEVEAKGSVLTPYSLRHRYVKTGQRKGIPPKLLADACGHSLTSHLNSYSSWGDVELLSELFDS